MNSFVLGIPNSANVRFTDKIKESEKIEQVAVTVFKDLTTSIS